MNNSEKTISQIKQQPFINMADLRIILGNYQSTYMVKKYFQAIREKAVEELKQQGKIIPQRTLIPAVYVWQYLETYGITR